MFRSIKVLSTVNLFSKPFFHAKSKISHGKFCLSVVTNIEFWKGNLNAPARENPIVMKLDTPEFKAILTDEVRQLHKIFVDHGFEIRIAGGAVRDLMLGKQPKDLDFATTATPDEMKEMFNKLKIRMFNERGEKHGTISVRLNDKENFEITTLRIDLSTDGRHAVVQFTKDWLLDANRRDLTINSMFLDIDGTVYDYFNGYEDLKKRRVVFVGDANKRITEDYLRILRYFRFYGRIAENPDSHDQDTLKALKRHASGLKQISGERIWSELSLILTGNFGGELLLLIIELGLGPYIGFPEKCNLDEFKKVWERLKLNHFKFHAITLLCAAFDNVEVFENFKNRAKVSAYERELGFFLIDNREDKIHEVPIRPYQALVINNKRPISHTVSYVKELLKYRGDVNLLEEFEKWTVPKFPVTGYMLLEKGIGGKGTGLIMQKLKDDWIESNFELTAEQLLEKLPNVVESLNLDLVTKQKSREKVKSK